MIGSKNQFVKTDQSIMIENRLLIGSTSFKKMEVKMIKIVFLQKIVGRDIYQQHTEVLEWNNAWQW